MTAKDPPEQGQIDCAVTAAQAAETRADAAVLLLWGASEALMAMVALATTSRFFTIWAQVVSLGIARRLLHVIDEVVDLTVGRCHGVYQQALDTGYVNVTVCFGLLSIAGFLVALFDNVDG